MPLHSSSFISNGKRFGNTPIKRGIRIIGDIPIFVAYDSADVWVNKSLFYLDEQGLPEVVAGVPPDYFSVTGQLWGNPLYKWDVHNAQGYAWWLKRLQVVLNQVDIVRLDHFRGFEAYWEVPFGNPTAEYGRWVKGPGIDFFNVVKEKLGDLPIIAEDLGLITPGVTAMRDSFNLPGMKILQFAFASDPDDDFLPHNYPVQCVAYTGTHDNNTTRGWYDSAPERERDLCRRYLARSGQDISWSMIRALWSSAAAWVLAPMQDFLSLGQWARMNYPGNPSGNWVWRMHPDALNEGLIYRLHETNYLYGRLPKSEKDALHQSMMAESGWSGYAALGGLLRPNVATTIPIRINPAPTPSRSVGLSFSKTRARIIVPMGSPRRVRDTKAAERYSKAQLNNECPKSWGTNPRARNQR